MEYKYLPGQNVLYNGECNTIFRKRVLDDKPAYLIRNIKSGVANDKVSETSLTECSLESVVDTIWSDFKYNGNNQEASLWIFNNVLKTFQWVSKGGWV